MRQLKLKLTEYFPPKSMALTKPHGSDKNKDRVGESRGSDSAGYSIA